MAFPQKPKRSQRPQSTFSKSEFYWELSKNLFKPALALTLIFLLGAMFINQRSTYSSQACSLSVTDRDGTSLNVRVNADVDETRYEWSNNAIGWQQILQLPSYQFPYEQPCQFILIEQGYIIVAHQLNNQRVLGAVVKDDQRLERFDINDCGLLEEIQVIGIEDATLTIQANCDLASVLEFRR